MPTTRTLGFIVLDESGTPMQLVSDPGWSRTYRVPTAGVLCIDYRRNAALTTVFKTRREAANAARRSLRYRERLGYRQRLERYQVARLQSQ